MPASRTEFSSAVFQSTRVKPPVVVVDHTASTEGATRRRVAIWLLVCCALVFAMVVVGGIARLTHSGLSIVEWQPIVGTIPPLSDAH